MVVVNEYGEEAYVPTKVFTKKETAEEKKDALLGVFHDIQANVHELEVVED